MIITNFFRKYLRILILSLYCWNVIILWNRWLFPSLIIAIVFTNISLLTKVTAESGIGKDVFKVIVSLLGITNSTGRSTLWVIDFKKGIAKKPILHHDVERTIKARYPTCRTHLDIEDYLLGLFCDNGFDIRLDVRNRKKGIIKFILPLIGRYSIER
jgi:hypothetical protein